MEKSANFAGVFGANFTKKQSVKTADFVVIVKANFTRNQSVCANQTSVFNVFLNKRSSFALSTTIRSRNEPMAKPLTSWLVPSFS